ncbi:shikimate dehydrogenase [Campylobacter sp. MIT 12-8780]|uniref:shikimate dehydrogenase n=1 Tax=unclassified Campylobacter TaxID=2593542 RepID=UPI00115F6D3E|nr:MULTISPECIES: shikimate dehydrogenase [unclassified Campylobacter]NDJ26681.1 shikimate dehydrogenase [Campylobacter sp. MIT 19-121]TQR42493.1 shikimate dehydrogenase [Campylobacter sp. MIT 12-8780]
MKRLLAVIGDPIVHSKSPRMHNNAIKALKLDGLYLRYHLRDKNELKNTLFALGLYGANITLPFKEEALKIADFKDELALKIGSANTLLIKEKQIYAYNTDGLGFLKAIENFTTIKKALILGAGGTAKALAFMLDQKGVEVCVANRSKEKLLHFQNYENYTYDKLKVQEYDLIINTTSAGLKDENLPCEVNLLNELCKKARYAFEVIYGKQTPFLQLCKYNKLECKDGLDMLLWQGIFAFKLFFDLKDETKDASIIKAMKEALLL